MATGAVIAVAAVGTAIQIQGQRKAARAKELAALEEAGLKRQQALDMLERFEINAESIRRKGERLKTKQIASFAKGGVEISSGATLLSLENTDRGVKRAIDFEKFETDAAIEAIRRGASLDEVLARDIRRASDLQTTGTFLTGVGRAASAAR